MSPMVDKMVAVINQTRSIVDRQQQEIDELRGALRAQDAQLKAYANERKKEKETQVKHVMRSPEKLKTIMVEGLDDSNPTADFIKTVKDNLDITISGKDFSLKTMQIRKKPKRDGNTRRTTSGSGSSGVNNRNIASDGETNMIKKLSSVQFSSLWIKRQIYAARGRLRGTNVFLSEDLDVTQHALLFKCRELRRQNKIKTAWSQDLRLYVRLLNDEKREIFTEADLAPFAPASSAPDPTQRIPNPPPPPEVRSTTFVAETPYSTPRPAPTETLRLSTLDASTSDSESSFIGFDRGH